MTVTTKEIFGEVSDEQFFEENGVTKDEFQSILKAAIRGLAKKGCTEDEITEERAAPLVYGFIRDVRMARITEAFLDAIVDEKLVITGCEDGEVTFAEGGQSTAGQSSGTSSPPANPSSSKSGT